MKFSIIASALILVSLNAYSMDKDNIEEIKISKKTLVTKDNVQKILTNVLNEGYEIARHNESWQLYGRLQGTSLNIGFFGHNLTEPEYVYTARGCAKLTNKYVIDLAVKELIEKYDYESVIKINSVLTSTLPGDHDHCKKRKKWGIETAYYTSSTLPAIVLIGKAEGMEKNFRSEFQYSASQGTLKVTCSRRLNDVKKETKEKVE